MTIAKKRSSRVVPASPTDHLFTVSFGIRASDNKPIALVVPWDSLVHEFKAPELNRGTLSFEEYHALNKVIKEQAQRRKSEKDGRYFIMAKFSGNGVRKDSNVEHMTGFVGDIDTGNLSKQQVQARLAGYTYILYSSYSHTPKRPVWRFVVLYAKPTSTADHLRAYEHFQSAFENQLDPCCKKPSQLWYTPACPPDAADKFEFHTEVGALLDVNALPKVCAAAPPPAKKSPLSAHSAASLNVNSAFYDETVERLITALPFICSDDRSQWINVGMAIKAHCGDSGFPIWDAWSMQSNKYDSDVAKATWNSLIPQKDGGVTLGTVFHLAQQGGYKQSLALQMATSMSPAKAQNSIQPLFNIQDAKVHRFVNTPPPKRRWLLHNTLPLGKVGMVVAPGGTGKSFLMIQLALAVATNTRLANHWQVDSPGSCLILCAEEDDEDLHHRLKAVLDSSFANSPALQQLITDRVHIKSMLTVDNLMTHANDRGEIVQTDYVDRLALTLLQFTDLKLIVIDPASRFRGGNENAAQDTTRFVEALELLRSATGATVLVVHHTNKGSMSADEVNQGASRGSSALTDGVRWQMSLSKPTAKQAQALGIVKHCLNQYVLATITKNNGAPPQDPVLLQRLPGGILEAVAASAPRQSPELALVTLIQSEANAKRTHTANSIEKHFSGTKGPLGLSASALRKLISACTQMGYLRKRTTKPLNTLEPTGNLPQ